VQNVALLRAGVEIRYKREARGLNYIREINAFYDWLETNSISDSAIALWYALMHINNKTGWVTEFAVALSTLETKTGLKKDAIIRARHRLQQLNRIEFKSRSGQQSALYSIKAFETCVVLNETKCDTNRNTNRALTATQTTTQTASIIKLNKTKLKKDKTLYLDFVLLTDDEYRKLVEQFGQSKTDEIIERLNSYGHQFPKKFKQYSSHYHTILNWLRKDGETKAGQPKPRGDPPAQSPKEQKKKEFIRSLYV